MASKEEEDIICPVCSKFYKDPVTLTCNHCFCRNCLTKIWETKGKRECPVCKRTSSMEFIYPSMSDLSETTSETGLQERNQTHWLCKEHKRKVEFFCQNDKQLVCLVCRDSALHKHHKFIPAGVATSDRKILADQKDDIHALPENPAKSSFKKAIPRATKQVSCLRNAVLNIAVIGESGAGKSSFVNAIRGLEDTDEGAAPVDEDECTMKPMKYPHPTTPNVNIWDLPGVGTKTFNANSYTKKIEIKKYDLFIIVSGSGVKENDITLAKEIKKRKKNFYFVHSKIDDEVTNAERRRVREEKILQEIRDRCVRDLTALGSPPVFLITSRDLSRFDFPKLIDTLEIVLPENKRKAVRSTVSGAEGSVPFGKVKFTSENIRDPPGIGTSAFNEIPEHSLFNVVLNIAITGESKTGKSSFVNAIRGLEDTDEGAAPVGEGENIKVPMKYPHPTLPNVIIWDLPGVGTPEFYAKSYAKEMQFKTFDFFIIVSASRFKENDINLAKEIKKQKKNFYFVRSKIDIDIENAKRRGVTEEETLRKIRDSCKTNLTKLGSPPVFLITFLDLRRFDFQDLVDTLLKDLPEEKSEALVMGLPVYSQKSLENKYNDFKKAVWGLAAASGAVGGAPVPGLSTALDIAMAVSFFTACYHSFGLDDKTLIKLGKRVNKPILEKVQESKLVQAVAKKTLGSSDLISKLMVAGAVETLCIFVPVLGNIIAAGVSFVTTRAVLQKGLDEMYEVAKIVIKMAELE